MNKLTRVERRRKYFNSIERLKHSPSPKRQRFTKSSNSQTQKEYEEKQVMLNSARWEAELAQLRKELDKLYEDRTKR